MRPHITSGPEFLIVRDKNKNKMGIDPQQKLGLA
jgi:hypothetical protein